jgi:hypothetical protein
MYPNEVEVEQLRKQRLLRFVDKASVGMKYVIHKMSLVQELDALNFS